MESLFATQPVPDGYKLILEEDTGKEEDTHKHACLIFASLS